MEIEFPIEFLVFGTPVSAQSQNPVSRTAWKDRVLAAAEAVVPQPHFASQKRLSATLYYFPDGPGRGDVDNIVKLTLDALWPHIYLDDGQIERVVVQRFEPGNVFPFSNPSETLLEAITGTKPVLYVRVSDTPFEELT
jgi:crossover junction endodeoxyribonuclease RusA